MLQQLQPGAQQWNALHGVKTTQPANSSIRQLSVDQACWCLMSNKSRALDTTPLTSRISIFFWVGFRANRSRTWGSVLPLAVIRRNLDIVVGLA